MDQGTLNFFKLPIVEAGPLEEKAVTARGELAGFRARPMRPIHSVRSSLAFERTGYFFPLEVITTAAPPMHIGRCNTSGASHGLKRV